LIAASLSCPPDQRPLRIGFERRPDRPSAYYTDPVPLPDPGSDEHQIDTLMRLLKPLGLINPTQFGIDLSLHLPEASLRFCQGSAAAAPFNLSRFMLLNLSSTVPLKFLEEDLIALISRILGNTDLAIGLVAAPADQQRARELVHCLAPAPG